ncbi:MAG: MtrB/PioB family outer membrane beta-barrel protein [Firmicutes bacterium]|nr:MtrB/PioB family outer membrane beta-barrel protein [Bacillota bacterium]
MKKRVNLIFIITILLIFPSLLSIARTKGKTKTKSRSSARAKSKSKIPSPHYMNFEYYLVPRIVSGERESAKFNEFQDLVTGVSGGLLVNYLKGANYFNLHARNIGLDTNRVDFQTGSYGNYGINAFFDEIPHNYMYNVKTLYSGIGTANLTLPPDVQNTLASTQNGVYQSTPLTAQTLDGFLNNPLYYHLFDETKYRSQFGVKATDTPNNTLTLTGRVHWTRETGEEPYFGDFGINSVELSEPINYDILNSGFKAEYLKSPYYFTASYHHSFFTNNNQELIFANPFNAVANDNDDMNDPWWGYSHYVGSGPAVGGISLPPSDQYQDLSFSGAVFALPWHGRFTLAGSWGLMWQNQALLPYTTNTALTGVNFNGAAFDPSNPASLPISSCDCKASTLYYNALYTASPVHFIHLKAHYREYSFDNQTPLTHFPGMATGDLWWENDTGTGGLVNQFNTSYRNITTGGEVSFNLFKNTSFTTSFNNNITDNTDLEAAHLSENKVKFSFDSYALASWLNFHISYYFANRNGTYDPWAPYDGVIQTWEFPYLVHFNEAKRYRDQFLWLVNFSPIDRVSLTAYLLNGKDIYNNQVPMSYAGYSTTALVPMFGLQDDSHSLYSLSGDFQVAQRSRLSLFYSNESYRYDQLSRTWVMMPLSTSDPYPPSLTGCFAPSPICDGPTGVEPGWFSYSNWTAGSVDRVITFGWNFMSHLANHLKFKFRYTQSQDWGSIFPYSPLAPASYPYIDYNDHIYLPYLNDNTSSREQELNPVFTYTLGKGKTKKIISFGYLNESLILNDYQLDGLTYVPVSPSGNYKGQFLMDTLPGNFSVNVYYMTFGFKF